MKEKILNKFESFIQYSGCSPYYKKEDVLKAMEEYASQFKAPASPLPISGDVREMAEKRYDGYKYDHVNIRRMAFIAGHQARDVEIENMKEDYAKLFSFNQKIITKSDNLETEVLSLKARDGEVEKLVEALRNVKKNIDDLQPVIDLYKIIDEVLKLYDK